MTDIEVIKLLFGVIGFVVCMVALTGFVYFAWLGFKKIVGR